MASGLNPKTTPSWWHGGDLDHLAALTHAEAHPSADFAIPADISAETKKTFQALKKRRPTFPQVKDGKGKFKFIDLFAGIGGFRLAGNKIGGECVFTSEWDRYARMAYAHSYGQVPFGDIHQFSKPSIAKDFVPDHQVLCGGFPCQAFSISGKQAGFDDERGSLFFEICKIAKAKKPEVLFLENVKNFARHGNPEGATFREVKRRLEGMLDKALAYENRLSSLKVDARRLFPMEIKGIPTATGKVIRMYQDSPRDDLLGQGMRK